MLTSIKKHVLYINKSSI